MPELSVSISLIAHPWSGADGKLQGGSADVEAPVPCDATPLRTRNKLHVWNSSNMMASRRLERHEDRMVSRITPLERLEAKSRPTGSPRLPLIERPRRNRKSDWARRLVRENTLTASD